MLVDRFLELVDPELRDAAVAGRQNAAAYTPMTRSKLTARRAAMAVMARPPLDTVPFYELSLPRPAGCGEGPDIPVHVINAKPGRAGPGLLHLHGGGFTASSVSLGLRGVQLLAQALDCPVVAVDYRLAPETTWAGSLGDNLAALLWLSANAREIGVDPARIGVVGESAGGGHAAMLALTVRGRSDVSIAFQALSYPMLDDRTGSSRRLAEHLGYFGWNPSANRFGWRCFLGCAPGSAKVPLDAVPGRRTDLAGLPPTWIGVGGLDLFVQEDIAFAAALNRAGVPMELLVVPGAFHGFDMLVPDVSISRRFAEARIEALRRGLRCDLREAGESPA